MRTNESIAPEAYVANHESIRPLKRQKRAISGVLLLDKPVGITSNAALTRAKILYDAAKAGHTGTLDPFASGLLPVCFGEATKFAGFMLDADKTYEAVVRLGRTTTTGDPEGEVTSESPVAVNAAAITDVLAKFTGRMSQVPPMHSAIKVRGQPLYRLARQGVEIAREARRITIHRLDLLGFDAPLLKIRVVCSKGTYIRVMAEDIGKALGCGAMLEALRRTGTGNFALEHAVTLNALADMVADVRDARLCRADSLIQHLPGLEIEAEKGRLLLEGRTVAAPENLLPGLHRAYGPMDVFFGLVQVVPGEGLTPQRMMSRQ